MTIDSPQNQHVKLARSLHSAKGRRDTGLFLAEGPGVVGEALMCAPGIQWVALCPELAGEDADELADAAAQAGIPIHELAERAFKALSDTRAPQGIAAVLRMQPATLDAIPVSDDTRVVLVLHDVRDPGNLGTMLRTADAFGAAATILTGDCADPHSPKAVRASAGALFHLPVVEADWPQVRGWAADSNTSLLAADIEGEHLLGKVGLSPRLGVIIGNEAHGLPPQVLSDVPLRVRIPMPGRAESLNAASAAAVMLYEAQRAHKSIRNGSDGEK